MAIQYVPYQAINKSKWDAAIDRAPNGLIYATALYLDTMAEEWDALILNDYEMVMPLTWRKKYGIYYLYQPFCTACLGVFGTSLNASIVNDFLKAIPSKFKYWDFYLNHQNRFALQDFTLYERINYILPLNESYDVIKKSYRESLVRNIKKSTQQGGYIQQNIPIEKVIELAQIQTAGYATVNESDYKKLAQCYQALANKKQAKTYGWFNAQHQLMASAAFMFYKNRAYYILVGNHPNGKTAGASHALIDAFIQDHCNQTILLDFEGSDVKNIAFFYSSFGAVEEKYAGIKLNKLPKLFAWLKK